MCGGIVWFFPCLERNAISTPLIFPSIIFSDGFPNGVSTVIFSMSLIIPNFDNPLPPMIPILAVIDCANRNN